MASSRRATARSDSSIGSIAARKGRLTESAEKIPASRATRTDSSSDANPSGSCRRAVASTDEGQCELVVVSGRPGELRPLLGVRRDLLEITPEEREDCPGVRDRDEPDVQRLLSLFRGDGARVGTFRSRR